MEVVLVIVCSALLGAVLTSRIRFLSNEKARIQIENDSLRSSLQMRDNAIAALQKDVEMYEGRYQSVWEQHQKAIVDRRQLRETMRRINSLTLSHEDIREYSEQVDSLREAATTIKQVRKSLEKDIEQIEADVV